jgi:hypothetical protein
MQKSATDTTELAKATKEAEWFCEGWARKYELVCCPNDPKSRIQEYVAVRFAKAFQRELDERGVKYTRYPLLLIR